MAVDLEAIRRRMAELNGARRTSSIQLWKPSVGEYRVRGVPWKNASAGLPFIERWFYYLGDTQGFYAPHQFNLPDPVNDLIRKLYSTKKPADRELAKKLQPRMRTFMAIVDRDAEDKGVMVWAFGSPIYKRLLGFFDDEDVGDFLDPIEGFDLKVKVTHPPGKMFNGKPSLDYEIDPARKQSKLSENTEQATKWLESVPNIDDMYKQKSFQEIETILNNWLNGGAPPDTSEGSSRGTAPADALDKLVEDVKSDKPKAANAKAAKPVKSAPKPAGDVDVDEAPVEKKSLDEAFDELMQDD